MQQELRLGRDTRWRVGSPAKVRVSDEWVDARICDVEPSSEEAHNSSETHTVIKLSLRMPDNEIKTVNLNIENENPLRNTMTHEIVDVLPKSTITAKPTDGQKWMTHVHDMIHEVGDEIDIDGMTQAALRLHEMGVVASSTPSIKAMKAGLQDRLKTMQNACDVACEDSDDEDCDRDGMGCGRTRRSQTSAQDLMGMQRLAAVLADDPWARANAGIITASLE